MDAQGRQAARFSVDARAHLRQRFGHPPHRPLRQRRIADQHAVEALRGQQAGEQAHAGAGIAAIQYAIGGLQAIDADAMHDPSRR